MCKIDAQRAPGSLVTMSVVFQEISRETDEGRFGPPTGHWLTLASACYFPILERTWGAGVPPHAISPLIEIELWNYD